MLKKDTPLAIINKMSKNTILEILDIKTIEIGDDHLVATMPVDKRTHQPMGLLHGGASVVLIESLGSIGSTLIVDMKTTGIVGVEVNANHLKAVKSGLVTGTARIIHCGKKTHIWQVDLRDDKDRLVCTGRLTVMLISKNA